MVRCIIKGTRADAERAAFERYNIREMRFPDWQNAREVVVMELHDYYADTVRRWFNDDAGVPPFSVGTLLWYSST